MNDKEKSRGNSFRHRWCSIARPSRPHGEVIVLAGYFLSAIRRVWWKSFSDLPPLGAPVALPSNASRLRFSLLRSLRQLERTSLYQMGGTKFSECYVIGGAMVLPAVANILIKNGWVVQGGTHWIEEIVKYQLSSAGWAMERQLEAWWAELTLGQRLRAALLE
ncbi:MAG TPA: hypothetical protein VF096_16860 [Azonexus sp.]